VSILEINIKAKRPIADVPELPKKTELPINALHKAWLMGVTLQACFGNGDWFTFPPTTAFNQYTRPQVEITWFKCKDGSRKMRLAQ
jgi:hypothetical protein